MNLELIDIKEDGFEYKFSDSLKDTGVALIKPDINLKPILEDFYTEWKIFFNSDIKIRYKRKENEQNGYFGFGFEKAKDSLVFDLKEFYHLYGDKDIPFGIDQPTRILTYYLTLLGNELLIALQKVMPNEIKNELFKPLPKMIKNTMQNLFRIIYYPPLSGTEQEEVIRTAPHENINLITLLPAANESGLQVLTKEDTWYEVPTECGTIIINVGDMLQEATCGYYKSITHQVVNPKGDARQKSRLSSLMFINARSND